MCTYQTSAFDSRSGRCTPTWGKEPPIAIEYEVGSSPEPVRTCCRIYMSCLYRDSNPDIPARRVITVLTELFRLHMDVVDKYLKKKSSPKFWMFASPLCFAGNNSKCQMFDTDLRARCDDTVWNCGTWFSVWGCARWTGHCSGNSWLETSLRHLFVLFVPRLLLQSAYHPRNGLRDSPYMINIKAWCLVWTIPFQIIMNHTTVCIHTAHTHTHTHADIYVYIYIYI